MVIISGIATDDPLEGATVELRSVGGTILGTAISDASGAYTIEVDEDLLFYYLNLTIINKELTQSSDYRIIMLNALNMNQERYCKLFNPYGEGGVTFQLLEDEYLRNTYCENCNN